LENFDFSAPCDRVMMRDYKFRQTEWPRRKARNKTLRVIAGMLAVLALGLLAYAGWQWFSTRPAEEAAATSPDSRIIPLAIPPKDSTSAPAESEGSLTPPGQATGAGQN
jgi:cytoskeletal protein RodZ